MDKIKTALILALTSTALLFLGCTKEQNEVVVYSSLDQVFSEPILKDFEKESGIKVKMVFDTEETKSTGVMNRLIAEGKNPQCDLFWSGDPMRNIILKEKKMTGVYLGEATKEIPSYAKDNSGHWVGFSARARVLIYNKKLLGSTPLPSSILELSKPIYKNKVAIANPLFGTTTLHMSALFAVLGQEKAVQFLDSLKANGIVVATSNGDVKRRVLRGEITMGLSDTDDAFEAKKESKDIDFIFLDQSKDGMGTLVMPNALSLIANSPNQTNGKKLMEYLLSSKVEAKLATSCAQMPLIGSAKESRIVPMNISYEESAKTLPAMQTFIKSWLKQ